MLSYAILKVLRNNRTLCFLVQGVHTVKRFSADISPFSLPYQGVRIRNATECQELHADCVTLQFLLDS